MEKLAFIVERLNKPPFSMGIDTMADIDTKSSLQLLSILTDIVIAIDPDQQGLKKEDPEGKVQRIIKFLQVMKFNLPDDQLEDFTGMMMAGDKEVLHSVLHWCLQRFEPLQKRAYLAKYLMPMDIPPDFLGDELINELLQNLKELQGNFKEVHKNVDQMRADGSRPAELRSEIAQLEQERTQLLNKIARMKKETKDDEAYFQEMLKVTSALRKEQEDEARNYEKLKELRGSLQDAEMRFGDASKRLADTRNSGAQSMSAEQLLQNLQKEVRDLTSRRETIEGAIFERQAHLDKLQSWESSDRVTTEDDVLIKRDQVREAEDQLRSLEERLEGALERNTKLATFRQASSMAQKKLREKEEEVEKLSEEKRRLRKLVDDKEEDLKAAGKGVNKLGRKDLKKYGAVVKDKIEVYKRMRDELAALRAELVVVQRTEQILKSRHKNLDEFIAEAEKRKGVEGYRETQRAIIDMSEKTAQVDQMKGLTLEQIAAMVDEISREYKRKQSQLQPLINELKSVRQEYQNVESEFADTKSTYDRAAVGLELEKQTLEKECDTLQEDCLREESRYHYLTSMISICKIQLERAEQEKRWQAGQGRLVRDFATFKDLYAVSLMPTKGTIRMTRNVFRINSRNKRVLPSNCASDKRSYRRMRAR